jgi:DNA replication regulator SLD3
VSRLFEAHVKVLELEYRLGSTPIVLIARSEDGKSYFAVERESRDVYVICKLGSWVRIDQLCGAAVVSRYHLQRGTVNNIEGPPSAKGAVEEAVITAEPSKYSKKKRLAIEAIQSMVKRPSRDVSANCQVAAAVLPKSETNVGLQLQEPGDVMEVQDEIVAQPVAADILENIRSQYFEALYLSKVGRY